MKTSWFLLDAGEIEHFHPFDTLPIGCIFLENGQIKSVNTYFTKLVDKTPAQIRKQPLSDLLTLDDDENLATWLSETSNGIGNKTARLHTAAGSKAVVINSNSNISGQENNTILTITVTTEVDSITSSPNTKAEDSSELLSDLDIDHHTIFSLLESSDSYYVLIDLENKVRYFNELARVIHKQVMGKEIIIGAHLPDYYGQEGYDERKMKYYDPAYKEQNVNRKIETKLNGKIHYINVNYQVLKNKSDKIVGFLEYGKDVTKLIESQQSNQRVTSDLKNSFREIESSQSIMDEVMLLSENSYIIYDPELRIKAFNSAAENLFQQLSTIKLEVGRDLNEIFRDTFVNFIGFHEEVMRSKDSYSTEFELIQNDEKFYLKLYIKCILDKHEEPVGAMICINNLTKEYERNARLTKANSTLEAVFDSTSDSILAINTNYEILSCNARAIEQFKLYNEIDIKAGSNLKTLVDEKQFSEWKTLYDRALSGESFNDFKVNQEQCTVNRNHYLPLKNQENEIIGALEVSRDITDFVKAKEALEFSEYQFRTLVENSPTGLVIMQLDGTLTYASPVVEKIIGMTQEEMKEHKLPYFLDDNSKKSLMQGVQKLFKGAPSVVLTIDFTTIHDKKLKLEGVGSLMKNESGENQSFYISFVDATEKHQFQQELDLTSGKFDSLFSSTNNAIILYDSNTDRNLDCNSALLDLLGLTKEEVINSKLLDFIPESSLHIADLNKKESSIIDEIAKVKQGEIPASSLISLILKDGEEKVVRLNVVKAAGSDNSYFFILSDQTAIYENLRLAKEKSSIYEALIFNSFDGIDILMFDINSTGFLSNGELIVRNTRMKKLFGHQDVLMHSEDEILSISPEYQLDGRKSKSVARELIIKTIKSGSSQSEYRFEHEEGTFDIVASQKMFEHEGKVFMVRNFRDITDEIKGKTIINEQLQALNEKNDELKVYIESNMQLENFAYIASHDLKAPIRSVISFAQLLKNNTKDVLGDKNARFLDIIISASTNMQVLIDDLLSFSKINTQAIEFEVVNMKKLLNHLLIELNESISEVKGEVKILNLPESIIGDASRTRQILQNLIMNGMKFVKEGESPVVEIDYKEEQDRHVFSVRDYGIGIEPQYLREIFMMFKKLHSENKYKGTGIGLSICKKIVEQHEGDIWVESTLGEGATFYFTICKHIKVNI